MKRRLLPIFCSLCLLLSTAAWAADLSFSDVPETSWYYDEVMRSAQTGLMTGTGDGVFSPLGVVTRGQVATALWRLENSPAPTEAVSFPDVAEGKWYAQAAAWAKEVGIVTGDTGGVFRPDDVVTRQELAVFLFRYAQYKSAPIAQGVLTIYADADQIPKWALDGMKHSAGAGLITGDTDGNLRPSGTANRAELAVILVRLTTPAAG